MSSPRIGTYNVLIPRTDTPGKGVDLWLSRREDVVETILEEFDIVGLQECSFNEDYRQGEYITERLLEEGWHTYNPSEHKLFNDRFHERIPIFWRPEAFHVDSAAQLLMSSWTPEELEQVPILENRYASFVKGRLPGGKHLMFFTLHLQHQTSAASQLESSFAHLKREESQRRLLQALMKTRRAEESVVIAGDFNTGEPLRLLEQAGFKEISTVAKSLERWEHNSFHDWEAPLGGEHFDRVFVTPELEGGDARIGESLASDHFPVSYRLPELARVSSMVDTFALTSV
jgi:endonuclease/exonuclease/phosphatase family metal-dependent hydrolase